MKLLKHENPWVIEQLKFEVNPDKIEEFIKKDHEVWTKALSSVLVLLKKMSGLAIKKKGIIITTVYWESREAWKSISEDFLVKTDKEFHAKLVKIIFIHLKNCMQTKHFQKIAESEVITNE